MVGDVEHVLGAAAYGGDFGVVQLNAQLGERLADNRQQAGAVGGDEFNNGMPLLRVF